MLCVEQMRKDRTMSIRTQWIPGVGEVTRRHERKEAQRLKLAHEQAQREAAQAALAEYQRLHPIKSGAVKIVDYKEPKWAYTKPLRRQEAEA